VLPLTVIFAPATLPLLFFMLAPCMAMYIAAAVSGSLNRFLRIRELPQHSQLGEEQQAALRQCTQAEFQKDAMPCISFMRGTEVVQMPKRKQSTSEVSKKVHPRTSSEDGESLSKCAVPHQSFELLQYEEPDPQQRWQQVYQLNSVGALLEVVKLQVLKVVVFGGFALLAYVNLAFTQFYQRPDWLAVLSQASSTVRWPDFSFMFDVSFKLPTLLMFDFAVEVRLFLYFGIALILVDELVKKFRVPFYASNFSAYQRVFDPESMPAEDEENELCRRLQDVQGGELHQKIIEAAKRVGGELGRELLMAMLRPKLEPHLARLKLKWVAVQRELEEIASLDELQEAITNAGTFVLKLVLRSQLSNYGVKNVDAERLANIVGTLSEDSKWKQAKAVFDAAMPLVQGKPTTANVEALLVSVLRLEDGKEQASDAALKEEAMGMIGRAVKPLVQSKLSALGVEA
jgi:hypothetical protein